MTLLAYKTMIKDARKYQAHIGYSQMKLRQELISDWSESLVLYASFYPFQLRLRQEHQHATKYVSLNLF